MGKREETGRGKDGGSAGEGGRRRVQEWRQEGASTGTEEERERERRRGEFTAGLDDCGGEGGDDGQLCSSDDGAEKL